MNKNGRIKHARDYKKRARKARSEFEKALHLLIADAWMKLADSKGASLGRGMRAGEGPR